jgi:hypothetical protein
MKAIRTKMSGVEVLIQTTDIEIIEDYTLEPSGEPTTIQAFQAMNDEPMGINVGEKFGDIRKKVVGVVNRPKEIAKNTFENISNVISAFAEDCKKQFDMYNDAPNEVEIEYSLSLNAEAKAWTILGAKAETGIKVRMKWEKKEPKATP